MIINKLKQFAKLGLAAAAISLSMGAMAHSNDNVSTPKYYHDINLEDFPDLAEEVAQDIVKDNTPENSNFSVDKFYAKYHLDSKNVRIVPLYLEEGTPLSYTQSSAMADPKNSDKSVIILLLDKKGNLFNIDKDYGRHLTQEEKDLLRDHTLLHEYAHTHFFHDNRMQSNKINSEENKVFKDLFLNNYSVNKMSLIYQETAADVASYSFLINHNQDKLNIVKSLLTERNQDLLKSEEKIQNAGRFESHMMTTNGTNTILKNFSEFKNMNSQDVWDYTVKVVSDVTVQYAAKFGTDQNISADLKDYMKNEVSLNDMLHDIVKGRNLTNNNYNPVLYKEAQDIINLYPELKNNPDLKKQYQNHGVLPVSVKTIFLAADVYYPQEANLNLTMSTVDRTNNFSTDITNSIDKIRYGKEAKNAESLLVKLNEEYKAAPTSFDILAQYNITQSLETVAPPINSSSTSAILNKSNVLNNIKKMKEQSVNTNTINTNNVFKR